MSGHRSGHGGGGGTTLGNILSLKYWNIVGLAWTKDHFKEEKKWEAKSLENWENGPDYHWFVLFWVLDPEFSDARFVKDDRSRSTASQQFSRVAAWLSSSWSLVEVIISLICIVRGTSETTQKTENHPVTHLYQHWHQPLFPQPQHII